jgi:hypothetical protein
VAEPDLCQVALAYDEAGRCVLPPVARGAKYPSIIEDDKPKAIPWKIFTENRATPAQLQTWFGNGAHVGLALAGGPASGITLDDGTRTSAEFLDIEYHETVTAFVALAKARGYEALLNCLPWEDPPRGGLHTGWLCIESAGNTKLAMRQISVRPDGTPEIETLIETRGEGGLLVVSPTPPGIHPDVPERGYVMVRGSWAEMPVISPEARQALLECAIALNEYIEPQPLKDADRPHYDPPEGSPGEDFNRRATQADVRDLLQRHGWTVDHSAQGTDFLRRPGKSEGYSGTLGHVGPNILYVFSSNASLFQGPQGDHPGTPYKPFGVYGLLEFRGDFQAATRVLALSGYGASHNGHPPEPPQAIDARSEPNIRIEPTTIQPTTDSTITADAALQVQVKVKRLGIVRALATEIDEGAHFAQDAGEKLYRFRRGVYVPDGLAYVKRRVKTILESWGLSPLWSSHRAAEVAEYLRVDAPTLWERPSREVLNLKDGLLDLETRELLDHDPTHLSAVQIPVEYNSRASCPQWESFTEAIFPKDAQDLAWEIPA